MTSRESVWLQEFMIEISGKWGLRSLRVLLSGAEVNAGFTARDETVASYQYALGDEARVDQRHQYE
jgi:hypothetical protein